MNRALKNKRTVPAENPQMGGTGTATGATGPREFSGKENFHAPALTAVVNKQVVKP